MIINFNDIEKNIIENFKGGEKSFAVKIFADENNKIMYGTLEPGASIGLHKHETNSEIIFIISGKGTVLFEGNFEDVSAGLCHYCPKGCEHSLINNTDEDLIFYAVVPEQ